MSTGLKANSDGSAAIQVGGTDVITLTSGGAATFVTSPTTVQAGTAAAPSITFSGDTNTGIYSPAADTIAFTEGGVESMRIDSSGQVGIGTSSPAGILSVTTGTNIGAMFTRVAGDNGTSSSALNIGTPGGTEARIGSSGPLLFQVGAIGTSAGLQPERARFNTTGALVFAGGTTTADGIGITFPATQSASSNANTLDDYEEGTWTPGITNASSYTTRVGRYTKIGNLVYVNANVLCAFTNTGTTNQKITGLPFTIENVTGMFPVGVIFAVQGFNPTAMTLVVQGDINDTVATIYFTARSTGVNYNFLKPTDFGTTVEFEFSMMYRTA